MPFTLQPLKSKGGRRLICVLTVMAASCGEDKKKEDPVVSTDPANPTPSTTEDPQPQVGTEAVELGALTPSGATSYALNALSSSLILPSGDGLSLAAADGKPFLSLLEDADADGFDDALIPSDNQDADATQSEDIPRCDIHAEALARPDKKLDETDPSYPKATLDCLVNHPSSSDAVAGNIGMVNGIMCAAEAGIGEPLSFTEAGRDYGAVTIPITEACFGKDFVKGTQADMGPEAAFPINVSTILVPSDPLPQHITLFADGLVNITIKMLITADVFAFTKAEIGQGDSAESPRDVISVSVDRSAGVLRFAKRNARWGDVWTGILHGQFGPNGQIESLDGMDVHKIRFGYQTNGGSDNTPSKRTGFNAEILTARGDNANGITYAWQNYRCPQDGSDSTDCYDATKGTFFEPKVTCVSRGSEGCLFEPYTFKAEDIPYMTVYEHFNVAPSSYVNPQQQALTDFFTTPEPLCFSTPPRHLDPNIECRRVTPTLALSATSSTGQALAFAATARPKKVFFTRSAQNPASERRISDWASACGTKQGKVDLKYAIGPTGKTPTNLITSIAGGTDHTLDFGIITGYGKFYTDYAITATIEKNGEVLATKELTAQADGAKPENVSIPFDLGGLTDTDNLTVHFSGTFTCKKNPDVTARNNIAYSMSWGPGALRVVYNAAN